VLRFSQLSLGGRIDGSWYHDETGACWSCDDEAFGLLEVLFAVVLIGIVATAVSLSVVSSAQTIKRTQVNYMASNAAISKIEEFAALDPESFDEGDSDTETNLTISGSALSYTRETTIDINADGSRSVTVNVSSNDFYMPVEVEFESRFVLKE
jgi:type II secretory pathway pseudopilin PulG